ncbi:uncharacterized protein LOC134857018 isoform X2 [Symsagittifera roscoffensis]
MNLKTDLEPGDSCDPNEFYSRDTSSNFDKIVIIACVFTFIHAPFLIVMPFCNERLKMNSRKIIAMIVMSDVASELLKCWVALFGFPDNERSCYWVTQMHLVTRNWSQLWSLCLIICVYLTIKPRFGLNGSSKFFLVASHCIIWPYGFLLDFITAGHPPYAIKYYASGGSVIEGCRGNFSFEVSKDEEDCLMVGTGKELYKIQTANIILIMILTIIFFALSMKAAYESYQTCRSKCRENMRASVNVIFDISAEFSLKIIQTTTKLSLTALIYIIAILPLLCLNFFQFKHGNINNSAVRQFFNLYPYLCTSLIGMMNIISYGYMSSVFRRETTNIFKRMVRMRIFRSSTDDEQSPVISTRSETMGLSTNTFLDDKQIFEHAAFTSLVMTG